MRTPAADPAHSTTTRALTGRSPVAPAVSQDAVVIVPGIMGSALRNAHTGEPVWGLSPKLLAGFWSDPDRLRVLHLTPAEREGRYGRIEPAGLLTASTWAPFLKGVEPYTDLVDTIREVVADRAAVLEFGYDWRLPVAVNGARLAAAARRHLDAWRTRPAHEDARRLRPDGRPAQLVFVAHSMGGLVTQEALAAAPGLAADTRAVVTLGTPFEGSVLAATILNSGRGGPAALPRRALRELAATLPGVHDLLPRFLCVDSGAEAHRLSPADVAALGGDLHLATAAEESHRRRRAVPLPRHRAVVGTAQPTPQSLQLRDGIVHEQYAGFTHNSDRTPIRDGDGVPVLTDQAGDGTVHQDSASRGGDAITYLPLQHGALAADRSARHHVRAVITERDRVLGPSMGAEHVGLDVPDLVEAGLPWHLRLPGADSTAGVSLTIHNTDGDTPVRAPWPSARDGLVGARITLPAPGLYRVTAIVSGQPPITQLVLAITPGLG
ncbi:hypothetical protein ACGFZP_34800 [Kitasatospora sp. NPDC048239]|uniref:lipase/acyltransferase domain-containing protein n=1 Tax=Kitasatospora sp. NPDC048239 TaxID=3364046 RepID=UPI003714F0DA